MQNGISSAKIKQFYTSSVTFEISTLLPMKNKASFITVLLCLCINFAYSQKTFNVNSGNWNVASNWNPQGVPSSTDDVIIPGNSTVTVTANASCKSITFNSDNGSSSLNINANITLTLSDDLTFTGMSGSAKTKTLNIEAGTLRCKNVNMGDNNTTGRSHIITISTGNLEVTDNITLSGNADENQINIISTGKLKFGNVFTIASGRFNPGTSSTIEYSGNSGQTLLNPNTFYTNQSYYNIICSGTGTKSYNFGLLVGNNLSITQGTLSLQYNNITVNGTTSISSGATLLDDNGGGANIFGIVNNSGSINFSAYNVSTFRGLFTNSGTFTNTGSSPMEFQNGLINNGTFNASGSSVTVSTNNQSFGGSQPIVFNNVTINNDIVLSNTNTNLLTINGTFNGSNANSGFINAVNARVLFSVSPMSTGNFTASANPNTVIYQFNYYNTIRSATYHHLEIRGSQTSVFNGIYSINGNLTTDANSSGSILIQSGFTITGNTALNGSNDFRIENPVTLTINGNLSGTRGIVFMNYNNATINLLGNFTHSGNFNPGTGTFRYARAGSQTFRYITYYNLVFGGVGTKTIANNFTINQNGSVTIESGTTVNMQTNRFICNGSGVNAYIDGTFLSTNTEGLTDRANSVFSGSAFATITPGTTSTITYSTNGNQYITGGINYANLNILNTGTKTFTGTVTVNNVFNFGTGTLKIDNHQLRLLGSISTFSGSIASNEFSTLEIAASGAAINLNFIQTSSQNNIGTITLNRSNNVTLTNPVNVYRSINILNGNLISNGNITLVSNENRTARVASISCENCGIIGDVIAQRFIPGGNGKRKWRLLSSPINVSNSIAYNQLIDDIIITGQGGTINGFDNSPQNSFSVKTYTESVTGSSSNGWNYPSSINTTVPTGNGICVFVRGDRNTIDPFNPNATPNNATIDYIGEINKGDVLVNLSYTNNSSSADGFNLIGNPYPSAIDWADATLIKSNVQNKVWLYNPQSASYGIFDADLNVGTNSATRYIASGQGFFVKSFANNSSITFTEISKVDTPGSNFYRSNLNNDLLKITLFKDSSYFDESIIYFSNTGTKLDNDAHDASKFFNDELNFYSRSSNGYNLAINEYPKNLNNDTINLSVFSYNGGSKWMGTYRLDFSKINELDESYTITLLDTYLKESIEVREENIYEFEIDDSAESMGNNRFKLIINRINIGINRDNNDQTNFIAYPVPFKSELLITNIKNANVEKIELFNSIGELQDVQILNDRSNTININTEKLNNSGVYILRIHTNDNQVSNIRIMK